MQVLESSTLYNSVFLDVNALIEVVGRRQEEGKAREGKSSTCLCLCGELLC